MAGLTLIGVTTITGAAASASTSTAASISAVGTQATHTNQPSAGQEAIPVSAAAAGDLLTVAVETKFPGTPSFTVAGLSGGGVNTWRKAYSYLTLDGSHGQELWSGTVTTPGASTLTATYTSASTSGTGESASSLDVQEFASSAGSATAWSVDKTGSVDTRVATTDPNYPTLTPNSGQEAYFGYVAVPGSLGTGTTPGVVYQFDARGNQSAYNVSVSSPISPSAPTSPSGTDETFSSIGMLVRAVNATTSSPAPATAVAASPASSTQVNVSWIGSNGATGYNVQGGATSGGPYTAVASGLASTSYSDTGLTPATTYYYVVSATNAGGESVNSAQVSATTRAAACTAGQWQGQYFPNRTLSGAPVATTCENQINHNWGYSGPGVGGLGGSNFSVRWTQTTPALSAGHYTFNLTGDDGIRLLLDGTKIIDGWRDQAPTSYSTTVPVSAATHTIVVEYYQAGGGAVAIANYRPGSRPTSGHPSGDRCHCSGE